MATAAWNLSGMYAEACTCAAACPCIMLSDPTEGTCTAIVGWHIDKGQYGDIGLDGLNVAVGVTPRQHGCERLERGPLYRRARH